MSNENKNDVVIIKLDTERELRFGHKALKNLSAATGMSMDAMAEGDIDFSQLEVIIFYGLKADDIKNHGGQLKLEDMEDLLDSAPTPHYYIQKMTEAFSTAFGDGTEGNAQNPAGKSIKKR